MNKFLNLILISILLFSCKTEKVADQNVVMKKDTVLTASFNPPDLSEDFYRELYKDQQNIIINQDNREQKEEYLHKAYFANNNTLITFGSARKINPATGQTINRAMIRRAALLDAKRWASYGLLWLKNDLKPDFGKINDINAVETKEIYSFDVGDSLVIVLANKVH